MQAANSKQGAPPTPPPRCLDANITWCGDYHRQGIPDGHLCKWDPMGALFTLLNILDSADKLAHQNRARETTTLLCVSDWRYGPTVCVLYVFPTIYIHHEVCVHAKARGPLQYPLKGFNIHVCCLLKTAGKQSSLLLQRLYWDSLQNLPRPPDALTDNKLADSMN